MHCLQITNSMHTIPSHIVFRKVLGQGTACALDLRLQVRATGSATELARTADLGM